MGDIIFDLKNNDIGTSNGDFAVVVDPSIQNATLMLLKNPVNILQPQFGVGFETFALNARPDYVSMLAATAKRQVIRTAPTTATSASPRARTSANTASR